MEVRQARVRAGDDALLSFPRALAVGEGSLIYLVRNPAPARSGSAPGQQQGAPSPRQSRERAERAPAPRMQTFSSGGVERSVIMMPLGSMTFGRGPPPGAGGRPLAAPREQGESESQPPSPGAPGESARRGMDQVMAVRRRRRLVPRRDSAASPPVPVPSLCAARSTSSAPSSAAPSRWPWCASPRDSPVEIGA